MSEQTVLAGLIAEVAKLVLESEELHASLKRDVDESYIAKMIAKIDEDKLAKYMATAIVERAQWAGHGSARAIYSNALRNAQEKAEEIITMRLVEQEIAANE